MKNNNHFVSIDGKEIYFHKWTVSEPIATVQIIHGMAEHGKRYANFAKFLNEKKINVFATDHRGHGLSKKEEEIFGDIGKNGFELMVEDEGYFAKLIQEKYKLPHIIFSHSMGSFICQLLIQKNKNIANGIILSGSSSELEKKAKLGKIIAKLSLNIFGIRPSKLLDTLSFYDYNKFTEKRTSFDWLSNDKKEVDKYINDSHSGFISPNILYFYLFESLINLWKDKKLENINKTLPIYIFSGDKDPIGNYGLAVQNLYDLYTNIGVENIQIKIYKDGRHEMLNELNKLEVYNDIYQWINNILLQDEV